MYVGQPLRRPEDLRFLTGRGNYVDDVKVPNTAYLAFLRSPHAHARIVRIDTSKAASRPGVLRVVTAEDWTRAKLGKLVCVHPMPFTDGRPMREVLRPVLAAGEVTRPRGEPLEQAVSRVLTKELARSLHTPRVVAYPWYRRTRPDYQVSIDVLQFERDEPQDRVVLVARWEVRALRGDDLHLYRESRLSADSRGDGTPDVVAALHAVLVDFSAELAKGVQELQALPPQPAITSEDLPPSR